PRDCRNERSCFLVDKARVRGRQWVRQKHRAKTRMFAMSETIGVIAMGEMGSATARRLHERGATVITQLAGRSAASAARAERAGAIAVATDDEFAAQSDFILSIVPPGDAVALAQRLAPALKRANRKTVYVDCNAVSPQTAERIGEALKDTGCIYVDAGIIGPPPGPNARTV